ncbi:hypothetical protein [Shewanella sp. FJAT-52076]|uniref:hypothetical protein n=1 Tax=Shewanella sp. FJAT-52076 TaxID=2864202 RepID=UPI001C658437|nr:hypothetical protein [Shewanella sp. FJAT-52076]QYJ74364.1 hypothetical protein K0H79_13455 [Shewanella sp. FJAT-52076]
MKALLMTSGLLGLTLLGNTALASPMETMTVIYRSPVDYALYQQKAEMLGYFQLELHEGIRLEAKTQLRQMATRFAQADNRLVRHSPTLSVPERVLSAPR